MDAMAPARKMRDEAVGDQTVTVRQVIREQVGAMGNEEWSWAFMIPSPPRLPMVLAKRLIHFDADRAMWTRSERLGKRQVHASLEKSESLPVRRRNGQRWREGGRLRHDNSVARNEQTSVAP